MKQWMIAATFMAVCNAPVQALNLDYAGFYDRLKIVNKADYPLVDIAFYLNHRDKAEPCQIDDGYIYHRGEKLPLSIGEQQELLVPFDEQLKKDKAALVLTLQDELRCDFAMQLRYSDVTQQQFSQQDWHNMAKQFDEVLKRFAGFPFGWLQPDVTGVVVKLVPNAYVDNALAQNSNERLILRLSELSEQDIEFSEPPLWISPFIER